MTDPILDQFKLLLSEAYSAHATDVHIRACGPLRVRIAGDLKEDSRFTFDTSQLHKIVTELVTEENRKKLVKYKV